MLLCLKQESSIQHLRGMSIPVWISRTTGSCMEQWSRVSKESTEFYEKHMLTFTTTDIFNVFFNKDQSEVVNKI